MLPQRKACFNTVAHCVALEKIAAMPIKEALDLTIDKVEMSTGLYNSLAKMGVVQLRHMIRVSEDVFYQRQGFGDKRLMELVDIKQELGFYQDRMSEMRYAMDGLHGALKPRYRREVYV